MKTNGYPSGDESASGAEQESQLSNDRVGHKVKDEGPACQACRKKKAKCTRRVPCSQCIKHKVECIYDDTRSKPGMRTGAIEALNQRLSTLENMFLGQGVLWEQVWRCLAAVGDKLDLNPNPHGTDDHPQSTNIQESTSRLEALLSSLAAGQDKAALREGNPKPAKRRRIEYPEPEVPIPTPQTTEVFAGGAETDLPDDLVDDLVDIYFARVHPWIPMLHVVRFRQDMANQRMRPELATVFLAIISICLRFSSDPRLGGLEERSRLAKACRQRVILQSMESFSVQNLQAMIILTFDTIGSGHGPSAWSLVGSMTRTVEQLQLSLEDEDRNPSPGDSIILVKRIDFLPPCHDWIETEGRRRVFWNAFLLDRFCSITTGWNLSLTRADVKRRLPCEGALWEKGLPLATPTPYFGVSENSDRLNDPLPSTQAGTLNEDASDSIGGFAYAIEATESLNLITSFFLKQAVDITNIHKLQIWLMRFKQLDLRLVQWKLFLPDRWQEARARNADGNMDPNLTLAHVTHNTAVVLLHQCIAYPSPEWHSIPIRLPSASSADACLAAAKEVALITDTFLRDADYLPNPQFSFCLFVCGRVLITHAAYSATPIAQEFETLVNSLTEIGIRWAGPLAASSSVYGNNLASKFASRLLKDKTSVPRASDIRQAAYSDHDPMPEPASSSKDHVSSIGAYRSLVAGNQPSSEDWQGARSADVQHLPASQPQQSPPDSVSMAFPPLPVALQMPSASGSAAPLGNFANMGQCTPMFDAAKEQQMIMPGMQCKDGGTGFEALNSYLDYSYPVDQRVSMFSHLDDE